MLVSKILDDIFLAASKTVPDTVKALDRELKDICRNGGKDFWNALNNRGRDYMTQVKTAIQSQQPIPLPQDMVRGSGKRDGKDMQRLMDLLGTFKCKSSVKLLTVRGVLELRDSGTIRIPPFQRNYVWSPQVGKKFLRNVLRGIPILSIMVAVDPDTEERFLLDGVQRTETLSRFFNDKTSLEKFKYNDLPEQYKNTFLMAYVPVTECEVSKEHWPEIFQEINRGGSPLSDIEIWRAIFRHPLLGKLEDISTDNVYWNEVYARNKDKRFKGMAVLLRAVAMHANWRDYQKPMTKFVVGFLKELDVNPDIVDADKMYSNISRILFAIQHTGRSLFRIEESSQTNSGLVDCMINAGLIALETEPNCSGPTLNTWLNQTYTELIGDPSVTDTLKLNTSDNENVIYRMTRSTEIIKQVMQKPLVQPGISVL